MTKDEFTALWRTRFPDSVPWSHAFKLDFPKRWVRLHSLPEAKRYPETTSEWNTVLSRQNACLSELLGENSSALLVTGMYQLGTGRGVHLVETEPAFQSYQFTVVDTVSLHAWRPKEFDEDQFFSPAFAPVQFKAGAHDRLLRSIAEDRARAFFVSSDWTRVVAPYDGGVDCLLRDEAARQAFAQKFRQWLPDDWTLSSHRATGIKT